MKHGPTGQENGRRRAVAAVAAVALTSIAVVGGATSAGATTHRSSTRGTLQLCAHSTSGKRVTFHVMRGHSAFTRTLRTAAHHTVCTSGVTVSRGSYHIVEAAASGEHVTKVAVSPSSRAVKVKAASAYATARVASRHNTRAVFSNAKTTTPPPPPVPPAPTPTPPTTNPDPGTGFLEVCKAAGDGYVHGSVSVAITDGSFSTTQIIPVGQCTPAIQVPAGAATITETVTSPYYLAGVTTMPSTALTSTNLPGGSAVVQVAASTDGSVETTATLVNKTNLGTVKICKTLAPNTTDLVAAGDNAFRFAVSYPGSLPGEVATVVVPAAGDTSCVLTEPIPVGTPVSVTELTPANTTLQGITVQPAADQVSISSATAIVAVDQDPNTHTQATFTNSADGTIEICKQIDDSYWERGGDWEGDGPNHSPYDGTNFHFSVNGGAPITVQAGACSPAISVPAGTATVSEIQDTPNFNLEGFTATGPDGSTRLVSGTNPITVNVPFGGVGNETLVTATNRVQTAQVKICKELNNVPVGKTYTFKATITLGDHNYRYPVSLTPTDNGPSGEVCSYLSSSLPVITPSGSQLAVTVTEGKSPFGYQTTTGGVIVEPTEIDYAGNGKAVDSKVYKSTDTSDDDGTYFLTAVLGQGVNEITFVNSLVLDP